MSTRAIIIEITGSDPAVLRELGEKLADAFDTIMENQAMPDGVTYTGVCTSDPDNDEEEAEDEIREG